jgi:hypothetical protein
MFPGLLGILAPHRTVGDAAVQTNVLTRMTSVYSSSGALCQAR